ncbi:MAG TPA: hypothetical protein VK563_12975 [Puia sp.]|nr:hypothetical protein [Puia sp.]
MIPYLIEAELVVTDSLCMISGNALAQEWKEVSHAESQAVEKMMSVLHDELQKPLLDGGWKATTEKMSSPAADPRPARPRQVGRQLSFGGAPFVNIVVHITASRQATTHILQKIDWHKIEGALKD